MKTLFIIFSIFFTIGNPLYAIEPQKKAIAGTAIEEWEDLKRGLRYRPTSWGPAAERMKGRPDQSKETTAEQAKSMIGSQQMVVRLIDKASKLRMMIMAKNIKGIDKEIVQIRDTITKLNEAVDGVFSEKDTREWQETLAKIDVNLTTIQEETAREEFERARGRYTKLQRDFRALREKVMKYQGGLRSFDA